jgi:DNA mismatch endonuclease (patch repair protein)
MVAVAHGQRRSRLRSYTHRTSRVPEIYAERAVTSSSPDTGVNLSVPPAPSSATARKVMQGNRSESSVERALRSELNRRGLRFRKHLAPIPGLRCRPDVVFTKRRLAVFVDGCFWHRCPQHGSAPKANSQWWRQKLDSNVARDRRNDEALTSAGWEVIRLWAHDSAEVMADVVERALASRGR